MKAGVHHVTAIHKITRWLALFRRLLFDCAGLRVVRVTNECCGDAILSIGNWLFLSGVCADRDQSGSAPANGTDPVELSGLRIHYHRRVHFNLDDLRVTGRMVAI